MQYTHEGLQPYSLLPPAQAFTRCAIQANYRKTQSMLFPRSESSKGDYQTEYGRRYVSQREPPRTSADVSSAPLMVVVVVSRAMRGLW